MISEFRVYDDGMLVFSGRFHSQLEIGRQQPNEPSPISYIQVGNTQRLILADTNDRSFSRRQAVVELLGTDRVRIENSSNALLFQANDVAIQPGEKVEHSLPVVVDFGGKAIRILPVAIESTIEGTLVRLPMQITIPRRSSEGSSQPTSLVPPGNEMGRGLSIFGWLQATQQISQSLSDSEQSLDEVAQGMVELIPLDVAAVLRLEAGIWSVAALHSRISHAESRRPDHTLIDESAWQPSPSILDNVIMSKSTFRQLPDAQALAAGLLDAAALVASPILNRSSEVVGALYGCRFASEKTEEAISEVQAQLVDLLACGVAAGLARVEREQ